MRLLIGIFFICLIFPCRTIAQEQSLKNLKSLNVVIEYFPSALQDSNLSRDQIKNNIESKLEQNGIQVDSDTTFSYLYLGINTLPIEYKNGDIVRYVYNVEIKIMQPVTLLRDDSIFDFGSATWSKNGLGHTIPSRLEEDINKMVDELMNRFIKVYFESNPQNDLIT